MSSAPRSVMIAIAQAMLPACTSAPSVTIGLPMRVVQRDRRADADEGAEAERQHDQADGERVEAERWPACR